MIAALMGTSALWAPAAAAAPPPELSVRAESVVESVPGEKEFTVTVELSAQVDDNIRVTVSTEEGSATSGSDYVTQSEQVSFPPGRPSSTVTLTLLGDDVAESDETFTVVLSDPIGATIAAGSADVLVIDDDTADTPAESVTVLPDIDPRECPNGDDCTSVVVRCDGTPPVRGWFSVAEPTAPARGVIVMFSGARGETYWAATEEDVVDDLNAEGFEVVRVAWPDGWMTLADGPPGVDVAGCRPATITDWLHDTRYVPLDLDPARYACGFCIGGNSGGGTQSAYVLAEYGLDTIVDAAIVTSGPSLAALAEGCLGVAEYALSEGNRGLVDLAYGFEREEDGPCLTGDPAYEQIWRDDSLADGMDDKVYPNTRVEVVIGGEDTTTVPAGAQLYLDELTQAGSPSVTKTVYPTAGHGLTAMLGDPEARAGIIASFAAAGGGDPEQHTLTVAKTGRGSGTVDSSPSGIDCGSDCSHDYDAGDVVTLTATPAADSTFAGWKAAGECPGTNPTCVVTMTASKTISARFKVADPAETATLTVSKDGNAKGKVSSSPAGIKCGRNCSAEFDAGTVVTLMAAPTSADSEFTGWSGGGCSGASPTCVVTLSSDALVTATFTRN